MNQLVPINNFSPKKDQIHFVETHLKSKTNPFLYKKIL